jgi:hypothetical protein
MAEQKKAPPGKVALNENTNKPTIYKERQALVNTPKTPERELPTEGAEI